jgi:hypothetical protein
MRAETPMILRVSTNDVAPADRAGYWSSILSSTYAPVSVDHVNPLECDSELRALQLRSITFAAAFAIDADRSGRGALGPDRERVARGRRRLDTGGAFGSRPDSGSHQATLH